MTASDLRTARIRAARADDAGAIAAIYAPSVSESSTSFELAPPDAAEMKRRILSLREKYPWLVCESSQFVLGYVYASPHRERAAYRWSVDVAAYVRQDAQRKGVGRALYTSLFHLLSLQGFRNAYAGIALPNTPSVRMHEAMGFREIGVYHQVGYKLGAWHDVAWFERPLSEHTIEPAEPLAFSSLPRDKVEAAFAQGRTLLTIP
jgi:L-amino acid N-acyltransferase YncA